MHETSAAGWAFCYCRRVGLLAQIVNRATARNPRRELVERIIGRLMGQTAPVGSTSVLGDESVGLASHGCDLALWRARRSTGEVANRAFLGPEGHGCCLLLR